MSCLKTEGAPHYSDKASIFRVADTAGRKTAGVTQFGRALAELNIDILCANTPQAKGRVERVNQTLQDRLVKELRLQGISTLAEGNAFLPTFRDDFNLRFARAPLNPHDAHRPLRGEEELDVIFTWQEERSVSRNLTLNYKNTTWLIEPGPTTLPLAGHRVRVCEDADGTITIRHQSAVLPASEFLNKNPMVRNADIVESKRLGEVLARIQAQQRRRDQARLANPKLTLREKARIRAARALADAPMA